MGTSTVPFRSASSSTEAPQLKKTALSPELVTRSLNVGLNANLSLSFVWTLPSKLPVLWNQTGVPSGIEWTSVNIKKSAKLPRDALSLMTPSTKVRRLPNWPVLPSECDSNE